MTSPSSPPLLRLFETCYYINLIVDYLVVDGGQQGIK